MYDLHPSDVSHLELTEVDDSGPHPALPTASTGLFRHLTACLMAHVRLLLRYHLL